MNISISIINFFSIIIIELFNIVFTVYSFRPQLLVLMKMDTDLTPKYPKMVTFASQLKAGMKNRIKTVILSEMIQRPSKNLKIISCCYQRIMLSNANDDYFLSIDIEIKSINLSFSLFSSPGPKVHVNYCHHLASVVCRL